jgi:hypothetical protein
MLGDVIKRTRCLQRLITTTVTDEYFTFVFVVVAQFTWPGVILTRQA